MNNNFRKKIMNSVRSTLNLLFSNRKFMRYHKYNLIEISMTSMNMKFMNNFKLL